MKKNLLSSPAAMQRIAFLAFAGIALVGCTSNDFVGEQDVIESKSDGAINFNLSVPASTRATQEDATAAATLGNKFIVWGEKNEADASTTAATAANTVFQNYTVSYGASTANTTQSNTDDWEYVGVTSYGSKLTPTAPATQTIKYWDNAATNYVFTAVSALDADITGDKVVITKNTASTTSDEYGKGYTITVKDGATPGSIYIADRIDDTPANLNSSAVKFTFRNFMSKIRFGVFETIPGYKVQITKMYYNSTNSTSQFGVDGKFLKAGASTTYTVTYGNGTTGPLNKPIMTAGGSSSEDTYLATTTGTYFNTDLGTASNAPTYDNGGTYTTIFPYPGNTANIKFKIDFQLISEDTGETINITEKTAEVPAAYCKWQSNYAYTYLFKITDTDLNPITFDACVVEDENGNQETITTVDEPSITTFAVTSTGAFVTGGDAYNNTDVIYASVVDGGSVPTLTASNIALYTVTTSNATTCPITEENVADKLAETSSSLLTCTALSEGSGNDYEIVTSVPGETGVARSLSAIKWTGSAPTTDVYYVVEYIKTARTYTNDGGKTYADASAFAAAGTLYSDAACTTVAASFGDSSTTYYKRTGVATPGNYSYKVIKVAAGS